MRKVGIFIANGCEEVEALTVVDILRRGGIDILTISITDVAQVTSSRQITFRTDTVKSAVNFEKFDGIILPGGLPGTQHLKDDETVQQVVKDYSANGKLVAAICAAPGMVLGQSGILKGKKATCHPGFEEQMIAEPVKDRVVRDGNIITSRGMGTAVPFGLEILDYLAGPEKVGEVKKGLVFEVPGL